jgi:small subunit ribosomal protein S21
MSDRLSGLFSGVVSFNRQGVSRTRRIVMGVRIRVGEREPIGLALKRLKKLLIRENVAWEMRRRSCFADPTQQRRAKRFQKRFKARKATLLAQMAGEQPVASLAEAKAAFWKRTGKP